jgi:Mrp family chromosome partitioning ATPase
LALATSPVPGVENLWLLPSGPLPPNPSELLSDKKTAELLGALQDEYDVVLVDCPPVLPVADAVALSAWVDATLLIVAAGTTTRTGVQRAHEQLRQGSAPLVGTVLNRATEESQYGYGYRYQYRQPASDGRRKRKGAGRDGAPAPQPSRTGTSRRDGRGRLPADATPAAPSDQARPPSDIGAAPPPN